MANIIRFDSENGHIINIFGSLLSSGNTLKPLGFYMVTSLFGGGFWPGLQTLTALLQNRAEMF